MAETPITVQSALAWTFSMKPSEYALQAES